jgi:DNA-binding transcriptional ArsR family regulator
MPANISPGATTSLAEFFRLLGQPVRIQILLIIGREEACVCHIEAVLGIRQAAISQHLMVLRDAGLVTTHREGRNIFYRLATPELCDSIYQVAALAGIATGELARLSIKPVPGCPCPHCNPGMDPELTCQKIRTTAKRLLQP